MNEKTMFRLLSRLADGAPRRDVQIVALVLRGMISANDEEILRNFAHEAASTWAQVARRRLVVYTILGVNNECPDLSADSQS